MDFKTTLSFGKLEFTVNAIYFTDLTCVKDDQGNFIGGPLHDDADLYDITFAGESLSRKQERRLIHIFGWDKFNTWLTMEGRKAYKKEQNFPPILDACCGSRMFWFDKKNPDCLFIDNRKETLTAKDSSSKKGYRTIKINPDLIMDFTDLKFDNETFQMVVFDPPHLKTLGETSWMAKKYGKLPENWKELITKGFDECMRVLKTSGTLIFKWSESEIKTNEVLEIISYKPLFGHTTGRQSKTMWMAFMKNKKYIKGQLTKECLKCWRNSKAKTKTEACQYLNLKKQYNDNGNQCPFFTDSI